jgi:hypothetical protein
LTLTNWLELLENTAVAEQVRSSALLYATIQIGHLLAMAALVGTGAVLDTRLLGWTRFPLPALLRFTQPILMVAGVVALITGLAMFSAEAATMAANPAFRIKVILIALVFGNALGFHFGARRTLLAWAEAPATPPGAKVAGALALVGWIGVVAAARLIAFV